MDFKNVHGDKHPILKYFDNIWLELKKIELREPCHVPIYIAWEKISNV